MASVTAIKRGYADGRMVEEGDTIELDLTDPRFKGSTWFVLADKYEAPKLPTGILPGCGPRPGSREVKS